MLQWRFLRFACHSKTGSYEGHGDRSLLNFYSLSSLLVCSFQPHTHTHMNATTTTVFQRLFKCTSKERVYTPKKLFGSLSAIRFCWWRELTRNQNTLTRRGKRLGTAVCWQRREPGEPVQAGTTPAKGLMVSREAKVSLLLLLDIFVLVRAQKLARQCGE